MRRILEKLNTQLSIENDKRLLSKSNPEESDSDEEDCLHAFLKKKRSLTRQLLMLCVKAKKAKA